MTGHGVQARLGALTLCAVLAAACGSGGGSPTAPSAPPATGPRSGVWQGTLTDDTGVAGTLRLTLEERSVDASSSVVSGSWSTIYQDTARNGSGTVLGTITGSVGSLLLTSSTTATCSGPFPAAIGSYNAPRLTVSNVSIEGPYSLALCTGTAPGRLALTKP
jgi:hypothetical protein